jgi:hypothetical protein
MKYTTNPSRGFINLTQGTFPTNPDKTTNNNLQSAIYFIQNCTINHLQCYLFPYTHTDHLMTMMRFSVEIYTLYNEKFLTDYIN